MPKLDFYSFFDWTVARIMNRAHSGPEMSPDSTAHGWNLYHFLKFNLEKFRF